jgi:hypothetical protein
MTRQEFDETVRKIKDWLTDEGIFRKQVPDDNAHSHFQIEYPPGRFADIVFPKPRENIVLIASSIVLAKEHYDGLKAKSDKERKDILWDMRFELLFKGSDFQMITNAEDLQRIQFTRPLRFEGLTNNLLMDTIRDDLRCNLFVVWTMMRLFGEAPPVTSETMFG